MSGPTVTGSTGRKFGEPTIFSAILNANAKIVKEELTPSDVGLLKRLTDRILTQWYFKHYNHEDDMIHLHIHILNTIQQVRSS